MVKFDIDTKGSEIIVRGKVSGPYDDLVEEVAKLLGALNEAGDLLTDAMELFLEHKLAHEADEHEDD